LHGERGIALLEVLAALAILAVTGLALADLVGGGTQAVTVARQRERELGGEERLLAAWSLLKGEELDQRIGDRPVGPYLVRVQRPEAGLYRIAIGRQDAPGVEDLVAVVWTGDPTGAR
jgi:type II secretory pathway pseudopilin PulG